MPLNYSKWDRVEISDDSDIEGHPNVDKKSLIRWKQRDIHEKREQRKHKIASLHAEIACNDVLLPRLKEIYTTVISPQAGGPPTSVYFNSLVEKLQREPSPDAPPTNAPGQPTYDAMVLSLILQVGEAVKSKIGDVQGEERESRLSKALGDLINEHIEKLLKEQQRLKSDVDFEEKEQRKHITSEDIHDGFTSKYIPAKPEPTPLTASKPLKKEKLKETTYEVLNPGASLTTKNETQGEEIEEGVPELTPSLEAFAKIPVGAYEQSWKFIQAHPDVIVAGAADALLVAGFRAQGEGRKKYAKQCVNQSLLLQYCEKLGGDGVRVFFKKMVSGDQRALKVFEDDMKNTYNHLVEREKEMKEEEQAGQEQIQLVPENPSHSISFNVPNGPPPENLVLEGPGTEGLHVEEVRRALQMQWDVFQGFPENLQNALKDGTLEAVNKVLGSMPVPEAEHVVQSLDMAGILNFAQGGIRDQTAGEGSQST